MRRIIFALSSTASIQLCGVITGLISARLLGPDGRGVLASIISVLSVTAAVGSLSIQEGVVYRLSRLSGVKRMAALGSALMLAIVLAVAMLGVAWAVTVVAFRGEAQNYARLFLVNIPLNYLTLVLVAYYQTEGNGRIWSMLRATPTVIAATLACMFVAFGETVSVGDFLIANMIGNAAIIGVVTFLFWKNKTYLSRPSLEDVRAIALFGAKLHPAALSSNARDHLDRLVMTFLLPAAALGNYAAAATLAAGVMVLGVTIDLLMFPRLAGELDIEKFREKLGLIVRASVVIVALAVLTLFISASYLVPFLFGSEYASAALITQLLGIAYGFSALKSVLGLGMKAANHPLRLGLVEVVTLGMLIIAMPSLVLIFGVVGAAVAAITAQAASFILLLVVAGRKLDIPIRDFIVVRSTDFKPTSWKTLL